MVYTMMQACKQTNMTYQTLKFYCNEGLVPNVKRDKITAACSMNAILRGSAA